jgi:O-antigen/teichoic acid export membrane protein
MTAEAPPKPAERRDSIVRNTAFGLATQITTAAFTAGLTLYLVRALGPDDYGVFALAVGIGTLVVLAADFGISGSAGRFIADHGDEPRTVLDVVADASKLKLLTLTPMAALLFALSGPIANAYGNQALVWPLRALAISVFGQSMFFLYRNVFVSAGRVSGAWRLTMVESATETAASVLLVAFGAGAGGAAFGRAIGYVIGALAGIAMTIGLLGRGWLWLSERGHSRRLARYAGALFVVTIAFTLFEQIDVILIGAIISTTAVGVFEAPMRLVTFLAYGGQAVALGVAPRLSRGGGGPDLAAFNVANRYLIMLQAALLAPVLVWAEPIVNLVLGPSYQGSASVLRALAPFVFLSGIGTFITIAVNYVGEARRRVILSFVTVAINAAIDIVLLPRIGVVGGAIGTDVAYGLYIAGHFWIVKQVLGVSLLPLGISCVRCLTAAAAMAGAMALVGTSDLSWSQWLTGSIGGAIAYVLMLTVTGELSRSDVSGLVDGLRARLAARQAA